MRLICSILTTAALALCLFVSSADAGRTTDIRGGIAAARGVPQKAAKVRFKTTKKGLPALGLQQDSLAWSLGDRRGTAAAKTDLVNARTTVSDVKTTSNVPKGHALAVKRGVASALGIPADQMNNVRFTSQRAPGMATHQFRTIEWSFGRVSGTALSRTDRATGKIEILDVVQNPILPNARTAQQ